MFDVELLGDTNVDGIRYASFRTCGLTCSSMVNIELKGDIIQQVRFVGGCSGNTQGVAALIAGMKVDDAISRLEGIDCAGRGTSCPDQLARALNALK